MKYTVKQYFNGVHWDNSYTNSKEEAEQWKAYMENTNLSVWDRVNYDALAWFIQDFHVLDANQIEITVEIVEE